MNTEIEDTPMPTSTPPPLPPSLQPMEGPITLVNVVENLLRHPARLLHECSAQTSKVIPLLLIVTTLSLCVFGLLLGAFSGGMQLWAAPLKVSMGTLAAVVICLPSLYIFGALGGLEARLAQIAGVLLTMVALVGLLLLGFAPVVWVFSASTQSVGFMGLLALAFWLIALLFGARLLFSMSGLLGMRTRYYLLLWLGIFLVVTLQMSTSLRPIIGKADTFLPIEKRFFLEHWAKSIQAESRE